MSFDKLKSRLNDIALLNKSSQRYQVSLVIGYGITQCYLPPDTSSTQLNTPRLNRSRV